MPDVRRTQVLVAGAGPVGTFAAARLAQHGIDVLVAEAHANCAEDLRASTFHPPTLEMLDALDIVEHVVNEGLRAPVYHFRERDSGEVVEFDLGELSDVTPFPYRIQCEQHVLSKALADSLAASDHSDVLFNHRVLAFEQRDDGVTVALETPTRIERVHADYFIAADGGSSVVRKWLGAGFDGITYPEKFLCLSTALELADFIPNLAYVNYISDPSEWMVLLRVPRVWRILIPADEGLSDDTLTSDDYRDGVFERLIGQSGVRTEHRTIYRVHQRVVNSMVHGRIFIIGDAAHLNNPLGGFGMNSGIHDAENLWPRVRQSLQSGHDAESFAQFDRQRRAVTHSFIQAQTKRNKEYLEHGSAVSHERAFRQMKEIAADDNLRRDFLLRQAMIRSLEDASRTE